jgi:excisionase family DNA binding protein
MMTSAEVAQLLSCTQRMVQLLIKSGQMRALLVGSDYRISQKDYEAFVKAHETKPAD